MAISRFSTSRLTQGLPKYQNAWDSDNVQQGALVPIQSTTITSTPTGFSFTNIPQVYQDLMIVLSFRKVSGTYDGIFAINGDYTTNTAGRLQMYTDGTSHAGESRTNDSTMYIPDGQSHSSPTFLTAVIHLFDYTSTNRKTAIMQIAGYRGSIYWSTLSVASKTVGAATSLSVTGNDGEFVAGTTCTLYGIKGSA